MKIFYNFYNCVQIIPDDKSERVPRISAMVNKIIAKTI